MPTVKIDTHELRTIIREEVQNLLSDPDSGFRLRPAVMRRLRRAQKTPAKRLYTASEVLSELAPRR